MSIDITHVFQLEEIQKCLDAGITNLKFQGRTYSFGAVLDDLCEYFFSLDVDRKELEQEIDRYMAETLKNSVDLQLYALISKI